MKTIHVKYKYYEFDFNKSGLILQVQTIEKMQYFKGKDNHGKVNY